MRALYALLVLLVASWEPMPVTYGPPVDAPVLDPFRPPATPFGPGNRGLEYDSAPGSPVRAAAAGEVTFAGAVARRRYVTLLHADGVRTTYGPLAAIRPGIGDTVAAGSIVGTTTGPLLWTARIGDAYVDPAVLLAASGHDRVRLVPTPTGRTGAAHSARHQPSVDPCAAAWALARPC
jgi:murein DD-endopeptidase MepM/ murein hydrolase activator NlpD